VFFSASAAILAVVPFGRIITAVPEPTPQIPPADRSQGALDPQAAGGWPKEATTTTKAAISAPSL